MLQKASNAKEESKDGEVKDQILLAYAEWQISSRDETAGNVEKFISDRLQNIFRLQENEIQVEVENETVTVTMNEKE